MKYQQWNIAQRSQEAYKAMERQGVPTLVAATLASHAVLAAYLLLTAEMVFPE